MKPRSSVTSAEVARQAGVSRTTVSFVLNGVRNQGISERTRERVLAVAQSLGYQPNAAARSLASGASGTVALVIPKASHLYVDVFLAQLVATLNEGCHQHGLKMLIESTDEEGREPGGFMQLLRARRIDGLIVANLRSSEHAQLAQVRDAGIPLVVLTAAAELQPGFHTVQTDMSASAQLAVRHLIELGHRDIAYISFARPGFEAVHARESGWRAALAQAGITPAPALIEYADISVQSGYDAMRRLLARKTRFSALFAGNDTIAFGAMRALREAGLRVPDDVALVGYDDIPLAAFASPPLTTVRSNPIEQARAALQLLLAQRAGQAAPAPSVLNARLIVRESCGKHLGPRRFD